MVGGYKIVSFGDTNITSAGVTIPGIYEMLESTHNKPIFLKKCIVNGAEFPARYVSLYSQGKNFRLYAYTANDGSVASFLVTETDNVVFSLNKPAA